MVDKTFSANKYGKRNRGRLRDSEHVDASVSDSNNTVQVFLTDEGVEKKFVPKNISTEGSLAKNSVGLNDLGSNTSTSLQKLVSDFEAKSQKQKPTISSPTSVSDSNSSVDDSSVFIKTSHALQRLDSREKVLTFGENGNVFAQKAHDSKIQTRTIFNINKPDSVDEKYLAGKHLFIVDKKQSPNLSKFVSMLLPYSYVNDFGDIHFFKSNGVDVVLRGPFVLSAALREKFGVHTDSDKHIWLFDCPKVRNTFSNLKFEKYMQDDSYIRAFGFPPPMGPELEGLEFLAKLARKTGGKILSADTGSFFDEKVNKVSFVWRVNKILPPSFISKVLSEVFGGNNIEGFVTPPPVFQTEFSDFALEKLVALSEKSDNKILFELDNTGYGSNSFTYLFKRLYWEYKDSDIDSNDSLSEVENKTVVTNTRRLSNDWGEGYSFTSNFGFSSKISITTVGGTDIEYRVEDGVAKTMDSSAVFEYVFTWLPKDMNLFSKGFTASVVREQKISLLLLESVALNLQKEYGGVLLNSDYLPL